jgi:hypothetical protein
MVEGILVSHSYQSLLSKEPTSESSGSGSGSGGPQEAVYQYPHDLNEVLNAIKCGFYESGLVKQDDALNEASDVLGMGKYCITLKVGSKIDAYSSVLHSWCSAEVVQVQAEEGAVRVTFAGWGGGFDETLFVAENHLAPPRSLSLSADCKETPPALVPPALLATLESKCRAEHVRALTRPAGYVPHKAIAADVERVLAEVIRGASATANGGSSDILEEFQQAYDSKIVQVTSATNGADSGGDGDFQDMAQYLGESSYESAPSAMKIRLLCWLCGEMVGTISAKTHLEEIMEQKHAIEKASRGGSRSKQEGTEEEPPAPPSSETTAAPRTGKRRASEMLEESAEEEEGGGRSGACVDSQQLAEFDVRIAPLGRDRDGSTYWVFRKDTGHCDCPAPRIFREDHASREWTVFSDEKGADIQHLLAWLSDFGVNEVALKQKIRTLVSAQSVASSPTSTSARPLLEPAPPPMRALHLDVMLGPEGKLEAGVKDLDGRIIISTFKQNDQNRSCAKDAGILICDQLISLNAHPIYDITSLQKAMSSVKQTHAASCASEGEGGGGLVA